MTTYLVFLSINFDNRINAHEFPWVKCYTTGLKDSVSYNQSSKKRVYRYGVGWGGGDSKFNVIIFKFLLFIWIPSGENSASTSLKSFLSRPDKNGKANY